MLKLFKLILLIQLQAFSIQAISADLDKADVLRYLIESYGGEENLAKLNNFQQHWQMTALMGNRQGTDTRYIQMPDKLRVELQYPDKREVRILDGDAAMTVFNDGAPRQAAPVQRDAMRLQLMRLYSPLVLSEKVSHLVLSDEDNVCALTLAEHGVRVDYLIDKSTWRIIKVSGSLSINGAEMSFLTEYSQFEMVDGVLLHKSENKFAGNVNTAVLALQRVVFQDDH